jgi:hypothetical protein
VKLIIKIKKIWIFPFLAGLICLIAIFAPSTQYSYDYGDAGYKEFIWIWGLAVWRFYDDGIVVNKGFNISLSSNFSYETFIPGLLVVILLISCIILNLYNVNKLRRGLYQFHDIKKTWIITGAIYFTAAIIYFAGMEIGFTLLSMRISGTPFSFWALRKPQFGAIAPFISGILIFLGIALGIKSDR